MEELIEILEDINPDIDYTTRTGLVKDGILTSFDLVLLMSEISDTFGVSIPPHRIKPENFDSAEVIFNLIQEIKEDE